MRLAVLGTGKIVQEALPVLEGLGIRPHAILGTERSRERTERPKLRRMVRSREPMERPKLRRMGPTVRSRERKGHPKLRQAQHRFR